MRRRAAGEARDGEPTRTAKHGGGGHGPPSTGRQVGGPPGGGLRAGCGRVPGGGLRAGSRAGPRGAREKIRSEFIGTPSDEPALTGCAVVRSILARLRPASAGPPGLIRGRSGLVPFPQDFLECLINEALLIAAGVRSEDSLSKNIPILARRVREVRE